MRHLFLITIFLFAIDSFAQKRLSTEVSPLHSVELLELPPLDNTLLRANNQKKKHTALRFAEGREVNLSPQFSGTWESTKNNKLVWRQRVKSPNAYTLNLGFTDFYLPETAELYIYNPDKSIIIGPITAKDNDEHRQYWTPIIEGDELVLELQIAVEQKKYAKLLLSRVNHDFLNLTKSLSGSCNLDVVCGAADGFPLVDNYRDIISSVGAYTVEGIDFCSGALINNTREDCTPYFLTANHCLGPNANFSSVVVFWNFQNSYCRQPNSIESGGLGDGFRDQFNSGCVRRASLNERGGSDFTLVELDDPVNPEFGVFFAGWDRSGAPVDTSICIHHPRVEEKRISFDFGRLAISPSSTDSAYLRVENWEVGTTEEGSSGSPLFNTKKQIIGQLFGGRASCQNITFDDYGSFRFSWNGGGSQTTNLRTWLDPDNTGAVTLNGLNCSFSLELSPQELSLCNLQDQEASINIVPSEGFTNDLSYTVENVPTGMTAVFDFTSGNPSASNDLNLSNLQNVTEGAYVLFIKVSDGVNEVSKEVEIKISSDKPTAPELGFPFDGTSNLGLDLILTTKEIETANSYTFEISEESDFSNAETNTSEENKYTVDFLRPSTRYYWRAKAANPCGESEWSEVYSFNTSEIFCTKISSTDRPITIDSNAPNAVTLTIDLPYPVVVDDVDVLNVNGEHDWVEDVVCDLSFGGEKATLFSEICFAARNFNCGFDDDASTTVPCPPTDGNIHSPETPLSAFNGLKAGGSWDLKIDDLYFMDGGTFNSWQMELCYSGAVSPVIIPSNHDVVLCDDGFRIDAHYLPESGNTLAIVDANGKELNYSLTADPSIKDYVNIEVSEDLDFSDGPVTLRMLDGSNVIFLTQVNLVESQPLINPIIDMPADDAVINMQSSLDVEWRDVNTEDTYRIQLIDNATLVYEGDVDRATEFSVPLAGIDSGEYQLRVGVFNGCTYFYSDPINITINKTTSIQEVDGETFTIRPNPSQGLFYVDADFLSGNVNYEVYTTDGKLVKSSRLETVSQSLFSFNVSELPEGVYFLRVRTEKYNLQSRIVKMN